MQMSGLFDILLVVINVFNELVWYFHHFCAMGEWLAFGQKKITLIFEGHILWLDLL
jgi:hypothetical protein